MCEEQGDAYEGAFIRICQAHSDVVVANSCFIDAEICQRAREDAVVSMLRSVLGCEANE